MHNSDFASCMILQKIRYTPEVLEFALTWWFELNKIFASGSDFQPTITYWHGKSLQDRTRIVKEQFGKEFSEKFSRNMSKINNGNISAEMYLRLRQNTLECMLQIITENQVSNDCWDKSGREYFH